MATRTLPSEARAAAPGVMPWAAAFRECPGLHRVIVRGRTDCVVGLVFVHLLTCLGELLVRDMEALTRSTHALDALVLFHLLACQGEAVALFAEPLASLTHTLHRRVELVRRLGHDVFVLASLR
jgi:hypothetical protein